MNLNIASQRHQQTALRIWNLVAGLVIGLAAVLSLPLIYGDLGGEQGIINWFMVFIGTFAATVFFWWLFIGRSRVVTVFRGVIAGVFSAILAYPIVILLNELILREVSAAIGLSTLGNRIWHALLVSFLALVYGGWFTVLVGTATGGVLASVQRRLMPATSDDMADLLDTGKDRVSEFAHRRPVPAILLGILLVLLLLVLVAGSWVWFAPLATGGLASRPGPALDYEGAVAAVEATLAEEDQLPLNPLCRSSLLTHGEQAERVVVYLHGYTNCPKQFDELGQKLFDQGFNVYVPRMPHHGYADRTTAEQSRLTAEEIVAYADEAVDIAQGLGKEVVVIGLSGGGSAAGWIAQERKDVDQAIIIAPMFGVLSIPAFAVKPVTTAALTIPSIFVWWDAAAKEAIPGPTYTYPGFTTRAIGNLLRLGRHVRDEAADSPPAAGRIVAITNVVDKAVNNDVFFEIIDRWTAAGYPVERYEFAAEQDLPHDVIDPRNPDAQTDLVYAKLLEFINENWRERFYE